MYQCCFSRYETFLHNESSTDIEQFRVLRGYPLLFNNLYLFSNIVFSLSFSPSLENIEIIIIIVVVRRFLIIVVVNIVK